MVVPDRGDILVERRRFAQKVGPVFGMPHHFPEFNGVQFAVFAKDRVRNLDLPDIVKKAGDLELFQVLRVGPSSLPRSIDSTETLTE